MKRFIRKWLEIYSEEQLASLIKEVNDLGDEFKQLVSTLGYERARVLEIDNLWDKERVVTKIVKRGKK